MFSHSFLAGVIQSDQDLSQASLATRILIGRLRIEIRNTPALLNAKIAELSDFAKANAFAADDLAKITRS
ncbi:hypothetical protein OE810_11535 [Rhodobacteraceae bacterium XHP0102]|nr:hypothetical protein [Rhodobacteraceae bacterium XHP0102]